jgi:predicted PurR-regulated permease PerM
MGDPVLWGTVAFLLNYIPILGPMTGVVVFLLAGLLSINSLWVAFLPAGLYLLIHLVEGETVTPMLLARRSTPH